MKTTRRYIRNLILLPIMLVMLLGVNLYFANSLLTRKTFAYDGTTLGLTDPNFANPKSGTYPRQPNGFSESTDSSNLDIKAGVINVSSTGFSSNKTKYGINTNPGTSSTSDDNILMINSNDAYNSFGYISDEFSLTANGYYHISVDVYSQTSSASLYLVSKNNSFTALAIENVYTDDWSTCHFFVKTDYNTDLKVTLQLWIGGMDGKTSQGIAFFDNILAYSISGELYATRLASLGSNTNTRSLDMTSANLVNEDFSSGTNDQFEIDYDNSNNIGNVDKVNTGVYNITGNTILLGGGQTITSPGSDLVNNSNYALGIVHSSASYTTYSRTYTLQKGFNYRFTILAKVVEAGSGHAWFKVEPVHDEDETVNPTILKFSDTSRTQTNNYQPVSIYVLGDPMKDVEVEISFGLGDEEDAIAGQLFIRQFSIATASYDAYNSVSGTTNSYLGVLDLTDDYVTNSELSVTNADFTLFKNNETDLSKTYIGSVPTGWTTSVSENNIYQKYGIISTAASDIATNKSIFPNIAYVGNPIVKSGTNYALVLNNELNDVQSVKSSSWQLAANTSYTFMVFVQTQLYTGSNNGAYINLETTDTTPLIVANIDNINTNGVWECYVISIANDMTEREVVLRLGLGNQNDATYTSAGYAVFDYVQVNYPNFDGLNAHIYNFDLEHNTFTFSQAKNTNDFYSPLLYTGNYVSGSTSVKGGVVSASNSTLPENIYNGSDYLLTISSANETQYNYTSKLSYTFEAGMYKIVVPVYTNVYCDLDNADDLDWGATIRLSNFDNVFSKINTNGKWVNHIFYINADTTTSAQFVFGLGQTDAETAGQVFFGSPIITKITDEDEYNSGLTADKLNTNVSVLEIAPEKTNNQDDTNPKKSSGSTNLLVVSSFLTGLAVIVAVACVVIRRVNFKRFKRVKVKGGEYDRERSIMASTYDREARQLRDDELKELKQMHASLVTEKEGVEAQYKEAISQSRSLNMSKNAEDKKELSSVNAKIKSYNHHLSSLAKNIARVENKINVVSSEQYLFDITQHLIAKNKSELAKANDAANNETEN